METQDQTSQRGNSLFHQHRSLEGTITTKSLQEQLLEIEQVHKASTMYKQRAPIPTTTDAAPRPAPPIRKTSGMPNYMVYQGKTRHCWEGRCIYGSQPKWSIFSLIFFNIPAIVLFSTLTPVNSSR